MARIYSYDAFTTLYDLKKVLRQHKYRQQELTTELERIERDMKEVSELPQPPVGKLCPSRKFAVIIHNGHATDSRSVRKTNIARVTSALDDFADTRIGDHMRVLTRVDYKHGRTYQSLFGDLCENGDEKISGSDERRCDEQHKKIRRLLTLAHEQIEEFRGSVSGWILEEDMNTLLDGLKCDEKEKKQCRDELIEAWKRVERAKVALNGLEKMFEGMRKVVGCEL